MAEELDPKITRRYRELGDEEPPRELDQAILAAAHRAAGRAHAPLVAPGGRHRWYFAFGAAAILVLAVAITVQLDRPQLDPEALPPASAPAVSERKEDVSSEPGLRAYPAPAQERPQKPAQAPPPVKSLPAENAAKPQAADEARADRFEAQRQRAPKVEVPAESASQPAPQAAPPQPARPAAAPPSAPQARSLDERAVLSSAVGLSPERLLERVAELRKEGRHDEADKALAEFRQRYPEYRISDEMLKKVERPK